MEVKRLRETVINQIAAGEVIERPASVVKELVENAIDSGADRIEIITAGGGKSLIRVSDNGCGMGRDDVVLAIERHCTSKLSDDLMDIRSLGFRGEALPSIGAVSRLSIKTRRMGDDAGWQVRVDGGHITGPGPVALSGGTTVEVADLFHATPARLKFLKTERAESNAITETLKRIVVAFPKIRFTLSGPDRTALEFPATTGEHASLERIAQVLGQAFLENALEIDAVRENVRISGYAALPTFNRGNSQHQFLFVNGRPVRDKSLYGAIRGAYADFLARHRQPVLALFIQLDPHLVDVNVHPAKADVRFRDPGLVRGLIVGALREAIHAVGHRASTQGGKDMMQAFKQNQERAPEFQHSGGGFNRNGGFYQQTGNANYDWRSSPNRPNGSEAPMADGFREEAQPSLSGTPWQSTDNRAGVEAAPTVALPLGAPRAQLHQNYIVSQTDDGLVIVDQHAAHERLVYEAMKEALYATPVAGQLLLIPEVVDLAEEDVDRLMDLEAPLARLGLKIERFGAGAIAVRETPAILGEVNPLGLIKDLADEVAEWRSADVLKERLDQVAATMACHGSVRSGRRLLPGEMDALLRQMEATPNSGQCNHGRPTYVELKLKDIERLFGRR